MYRKNGNGVLLNNSKFIPECIVFLLICSHNAYYDVIFKWCSIILEIYIMLYVCAKKSGTKANCTKTININLKMPTNV